MTLEPTIKKRSIVIIIVTGLLGVGLLFTVARPFGAMIVGVAIGYALWGWD